MLTSILLLSHVIGDFIFQSKQLAEEKIYQKGNGKGFLSAQLKHIGIHTSILIFFLLFAGIHFQWDLLWIFLIYIFSHFVFDLLKGLIQFKKRKRIWKLIYFVLDQFIHLSVILIISVLIQNLYFQVSFGNIMYFTNFEFSSFVPILSIVFISLYVIVGGSLFVPLALDAMYASYLEKYPNSDEDGDASIGAKISNLSIYHDLDSATKKPPMAESNLDEYKFLYLNVSVGKYIGMMERLLILVGLFLGNYAVIIGVIGIKTWVRHSEFNKRTFSEYYLLGTMLSIVYSIVTFYALTQIFGL